MKNSIHWNIFKQNWTSHTYKQCSHADVVLVRGEWFTEVKPERKSNPRGWVVCDDKQVILNPSKELLVNYVKKSKLEYNKHKMQFNLERGDLLLCDEHGCFLVEEKGNK